MDVEIHVCISVCDRVHLGEKKHPFLICCLEITSEPTEVISCFFGGKSKKTVNLLLSKLKKEHHFL